MILCLDAGNSRLKYGFHETAGGWLLRGAITYDELDQLSCERSRQPDRMIACNVAGERGRQCIDVLARTFGLETTWIASTAFACGVTNHYQQPAQLGADRWAALIGARALHEQAAVVVMAGTATTVDALDASGHFLGGLILPGLPLMRSALARNTAGLPEACGTFQSCPTNTDDAIVSGAIQATLGAIDRLRLTLGSHVACIISGGNAAELVPHIAAPCRPVDDLVLEGILRWALSPD